MAAPAPLSSAIDYGNLVQKTTVTAVNTWETFVLGSESSMIKGVGIGPLSFKMQNISADDITFGLRLAVGTTPAAATKESIIFYEAKLPGTTTITNGGSSHGPTGNQINFSIPMHENTYTKKGSNQAFSLYINGNSSNVEFNFKDFNITIMTFSLEIYVDKTSGWLATGLMSYEPITATGGSPSSLGLRIPMGVSGESGRG